MKRYQLKSRKLMKIFPLSESSSQILLLLITKKSLQIYQFLINPVHHTVKPVDIPRKAIAQFKQKSFVQCVQISSAHHVARMTNVNVSGIQNLLEHQIKETVPQCRDDKA